MRKFLAVYNFFNNKDKKKIILITIFFIIGAILESMTVGLVLPVFSILIGGKEAILSSEIAQHFLSSDILFFIERNTQQTLITISLILITLAYFLKNIYLSFSYFIAYKIIYQFQIDLSKNLYKKYLVSDYNFFLNSNKATLVRNIQDEIGTFIRRMLVPGILLISEFLTLFFLTSLLIIANSLASFSAIFIAAIFGFVIVFFTKNKINVWGVERQIFSNKKYKNLFESFNSIVEIKLRNAETKFIDIFDKNNSIHIKADRNVDLLNLFPRFILEFFGVFLFSFIIMILFYFGYSSESILPIMALFAAAAFRILPSINRMLVYFNSFMYGSKAFEKINQEFFYDYSNFNTNGKKITKDLDKLLFQSINFNDVSFSYTDNSDKILKNLNLTINKGEFIGVSGPSGSGKSTFVLLMSGLLAPKKGEIKMNNEFNLQDKEISYDKVIGYVSQKTTLFDDTLKSNIAFGIDSQDIDLDKLNEVIKITQMNEFISSLPKGLDTIVGDDGLRISGGQRQRIAIARALYFDPQLLIFDEATSALDVEIENKIIDIINNLKGKLTLIFISHKMNSLKICDSIYELKNNTLKKSDR
jgi:ATP-binding cassette, subfamily B, bacterial PglK